MGFVDEVAANTKRRPIANKWPLVEEALGDDFDDFCKTLDDHHVPCMAIEKALKARGIEVSDSTLLAWRRKRAGAA